MTQSYAKAVKSSVAFPVPGMNDSQVSFEQGGSWILVFPWNGEPKGTDIASTNFKVYWCSRTSGCRLFWFKFPFSLR